MTCRTEKKTNSRMPALWLGGSFRWRIVQTGTMLLALSCFGFLVGCGGGGSSSGTTPSTGGETVSALSVPSRIELTKVSDSGDNTVQRMSLSTLSQAAADQSVYNAAGTDYAKLQKRSWVEDTVDSLQLVNEILQVVKDTGYDKMVNQGAYAALVETPGDDHESAGSGASSSAVTEQLSEMTVKVVRESNSSPMYIYFWFLEEMGPEDTPGMIKGRFEVTHSVDDDYPMGEMTAYIIAKELDDEGNETDAEPTMKVALSISSENGQTIVEFADTETRTEQGYQVTPTSEMRVEADSDFQTGQAYIYEYEPNWDNMMDGSTDGVEYETNIMQVAFNPNYLKLDENADVTVFDKGDLDHMVRRYKVFDAEGNAVKINSGFPVRFKDTNAYGYVGYYGMWAPDSVTIGDNTIVIKEGTGVEYQLIQAPGKLIKHAKTSITLAKLANTEMFMWNPQTNADDVIVWDKTSQQFKKIGRRGQETNWQTVYDQNDEVEFEDWENAWCDSLQANIPVGQLYANGNTVVTNNSLLNYHAQKTMIPGVDDFPTELFMYGPGINDAEDWNYDWSNPEFHRYVYDAANMVLTENDAPVVYTGDDWGREIRPLSENENSNGWEDEVYYSWQSGKDQWSKLTVLKDDQGTPVAFEAPLLLTYEHQTGYDYNYSIEDNDPNHGRTFKIEYDGFELRIPWVYNEAEGEWLPQLNLKDSHVSGLEMTGDDGNTYVLKGWEEELKMAEIEDTDPDYAEIEAELDTETTIAEPTIQDTMDDVINDLFSDTATWTKPADAEVKVIKGELVE